MNHALLADLRELKLLQERDGISAEAWALADILFRVIDRECDRDDRGNKRAAGSRGGSKGTGQLDRDAYSLGAALAAGASAAEPAYRPGLREEPETSRPEAETSAPLTPFGEALQAATAALISATEAQNRAIWQLHAALRGGL